MAEGKRIFNFSAGPCCLPVEVLKEAQQQMLNWNDSGMSVMEMSHRGKHFKAIYAETVGELTSLLNVPQEYKLFFSAGGATQQFSAVPLNLLEKQGAEADYIVTGTWGEKAYKECAKWGSALSLVDLQSRGYISIPMKDQYFPKLRPGAKYLHYTSNETIHGVQWPSHHPAPQGPPGTLLVCDMSSDFASRPIDFSNHAFIYAGAQKNIGPAGVTVCIARTDILGKELPITPTTLSWKEAAGSDSMYNTPPCWNIYITGLVARYLKKVGGLARWSEINTAKATKLYSAIDESNGFYAPHVEDVNSRSKMNVVFRIREKGRVSAPLEEEFVKFAAAKGLVQLDGHRSVGGIRASIYNAMTAEGVDALCTAMKDFQAEKAT